MFFWTFLCMSIELELWEKLRAQELCESQGGCPGLPILNSHYGLCGCAATLNLCLPGVSSKAYEVDVSSSSSVNSLLSNIQRDFSAPPCIAVNAAGITRDNFLLKIDEKSFDEVISVNLKVNCTCGMFPNGGMLSPQIRLQMYPKLLSSYAQTVVCTPQTVVCTPETVVLSHPNRSMCWA